MKTINTLAITILLCITISFQTFAQGYTPPSRELIETLLEELEDCKANLTKAENKIKKMEANSASYTLAQYNHTKNAVEISELCIKARRDELDALRKDYPGWFNSPNAILSLNRSRSITPRELVLAIETIEEKIAAAIKRAEALLEPKN
ncbi:hypothetical protein [Winogradskyella sp.]|uniref:hypothetical protein n=1 Tax=Winogradskyella sp. TaxID=1883156 RepID=UPI0025FEF1D5|nr:hypothetical protein [Winogradskyella sp.]